MNKKNPKKINMVIGSPIKHSKSPALHGYVYDFLGLSAATLPVEDSSLSRLISKIRAESIGLTAVTMPFKEGAVAFMDRIHPAVKKVKALNTIINKNGKLTGYNTDIDGITYALRDISLKGKNILLLGGGGAAHAVAYVVKKSGGRLIFLNRHIQRSQKMLKLFGGKIADARKLPEAEEIDVIINATPLGMTPYRQLLPVQKKTIAEHQTVFDLVYNPKDTKLLKVAREKGAKVISGADMFVAQGLRQIELWTGKKIINQNLINNLKKFIIKK